MINIAGYISFIRNTMGVTSDQLPDDSPDIQMTYNAGVGWVPCSLNSFAPGMYDITVYNIAASFLVNWSNAQVFVDYRKGMGLNNFYPGVISSSSDENTSQTRLLSDFFKNLSLADLQMLRDPYGRAAMLVLQQLGDLWGLTQ